MDQEWKIVYSCVQEESFVPGEKGRLEQTNNKREGNKIKETMFTHQTDCKVVPKKLLRGKSIQIYCPEIELFS